MTREDLHETLRFAAMRIKDGEPLPTGRSVDGRARHIERDVVLAVLDALGAGEDYTARLPRLLEHAETPWGDTLRDVETEARKAGAEILGRALGPYERLPRGALARAYETIAARDGISAAGAKQRHLAAKARKSRDYAKLRE